MRVRGGPDRLLAGLGLLASAAVVVARGAALGTFPIDGAYYVAKAISLGETGTLRVPWGNGIDAKFFPGLSVLLALPVRWLGLPWGWLVVEAASLVAAGALTAALAARLGACPRGACAAAIVFAVDPLVVKWGAVPYAELPALAFTLAGIELAFRAREAGRRPPLELAAAGCVGAAVSMRLEAGLALPLIAALAWSRRPAGTGATAAAGGILIAALPLGAHLVWLHAHGVDPGSLAYVQEFRRNFRIGRVVDSALSMLHELTHTTPPRSPFAAPEAIARSALVALGLLGLVAAAFRARALLAAAALLVIYPWIHALWYFADGRFVLFVWPLGAALVGVGFDTLLRRAPAGARPALVITGLALAAVLLAAGERTAYAHGLAWERVTAGPADRLARQIDATVGSGAEGYYEFGGPMVAVYRRARARFAYAVPDFFDPDVAPKELPALLEKNGGFVLTALTLDEWLAARVRDPSRAARFRAALAEPGRTVIVAARL